MLLPVRGKGTGFYMEEMVYTGKYGTEKTLLDSSAGTAADCGLTIT